MNPGESVAKLAQIRMDIQDGTYLNPFKARGHIEFLLNLCEELVQEFIEFHKKVLKEVGDADTTKRGG